MDEIKKTFQKYDTDGNGYISGDEAHKVLQEELGFNAEQTKKLIKTYDRNSDGRLSYEEFIWFYHKVQEQSKKLHQMFKKFDTDGNNSISFSEAKSVLQQLNFSDTDIKNLMELHDSNNDGVLQYEEFVHFWSACGGKKPQT